MAVNMQKKKCGHDFAIIKSTATLNGLPQVKQNSPVVPGSTPSCQNPPGILHYCSN